MKRDIFYCLDDRLSIHATALRMPDRKTERKKDKCD